MASEQELAEMERMSGDWRPDAPVIMTRGPGQYQFDFTSPDQLPRDL